MYVEILSQVIVSGQILLRQTEYSLNSTKRLMLKIQSIRTIY